MNSKPQCELEWLYYHLWLKTGPAPPQFIFTLPETVFYRQTQGSNFSNPDMNAPENWYFTSKDGYILKKNRFNQLISILQQFAITILIFILKFSLYFHMNVGAKEIQKTFTKKMEFHDQIAAVSYYFERNHVEKTASLHIQHMTPSDFRALLFYRPTQHHIEDTPPFHSLIALQKFVPCKQIKHTVYICHWQGDSKAALVEKVQNTHSMFDLKVPLDQRTPTFEENVDPAVITNQDSSNVPSQVSDNIGRSVRQIRDHIMSVSKGHPWVRASLLLLILILGYYLIRSPQLYAAPVIYIQLSKFYFFRTETISQTEPDQLIF